MNRTIVTASAATARLRGRRRTSPGGEAARGQGSTQERVPATGTRLRRALHEFPRMEPEDTARVVTVVLGAIYLAVIVGSGCVSVASGW